MAKNGRTDLGTYITEDRRIEMNVNDIRISLKELSYLQLSGDGVSDASRRQLLDEKEYLSGVIGDLEAMVRVINRLLSPANRKE